MKSISLKGLDKECYYEKLKNGFEIIMVPYTDKKNYFISYVTRYGSQINSFIPHDKKAPVTVPNGIAHFLEHKLFEQEDGVDPFAFFSESGTGANASTSYDRTQYICYGNKEFAKNLDYLLKYVNQPYFTDKNVDKEKGIIKEELKMYDDIPEWLIEKKLRQCIYNKHPRRVDIGGECEDIDKITKEDLYICYNTFYQPNNMFIVITGNFNKDKALQIIKKNISNIENKQEKIEIKEVREAKAVCKPELELSTNIRVPKIALGYKMEKESFGINDDLELDLYLQMISTLLFGNSSVFREQIREKKLVTNFSYEWDSTSKYKTLFIYSETENPELLIDEIYKYLENINLDAKDLERIKKVWIANEVKMIDSIDATIYNIVDDEIKYKRIVHNKIDLIRKLNKKKLDEIATKLNFNNRSKVILLPKKIIARRK